VIEFQKRGLPHCHLLLILKKGDKIKSLDDIDKAVSTEYPKNYALRKLVKKFMIHDHTAVSTCLKDGKCKKKFPKDFCEKTIWVDDENNQRYRRRSIIETDSKGNSSAGLDNRFVVGYNPYLLVVLQCHINVELCNSIKACKYLFKYIYKGGDRAQIQIVKEDVSIKNEIKEYQDSRCIGASEACWKIFSFEMSHRKPSVITLPIHLPNSEFITFHENELQKVVKNGPPKTMLSAWLEMNKTNKTNDNYIQLQYEEFPQYYSFDKKSKIWVPRSRALNESIGRIVFIPPQAGDVFLSPTFNYKFIFKRKGQLGILAHIQFNCIFNI
jgi:hypothetical protein